MGVWLQLFAAGQHSPSLRVASPPPLPRVAARLRGRPGCSRPAPRSAQRLWFRAWWTTRRCAPATQNASRCRWPLAAVNVSSRPEELGHRVPDCDVLFSAELCLLLPADLPLGFLTHHRLKGWPEPTSACGLEGQGRLRMPPWGSLSLCMPTDRAADVDQVASVRILPPCVVI